MKILKIYPEVDTSKRFNYNVNYGVWDAIDGDRVTIEKFDANLSDYDVVFLPQIKRWNKHIALLNKIKEQKIKKVLFDNDSCYRSFSDSIYDGIDYIFYRDTDKKGKTPDTKSSLLKWSVDTNRLTPEYGGKGIAFYCSKQDYPLRKSIAAFLPHKKVWGDDYIRKIQKSAAAIHTDSPRLRSVRAKVLEFASCGTHIISNRTKNMNLYFPDDLIIYFKNIEHLKSIVKNFTPDTEKQKRLREITVENHDDKIRAKEVLDIITFSL